MEWRARAAPFAAPFRFLSTCSTIWEINVACEISLRLFVSSGDPRHPLSGQFPGLCFAACSARPCERSHGPWWGLFKNPCPPTLGEGFLGRRAWRKDGLTGMPAALGYFAAMSCWRFRAAALSLRDRGEVIRPAPAVEILPRKSVSVVRRVFQRPRRPPCMPKASLAAARRAIRAI